MLILLTLRFADRLLNCTTVETYCGIYAMQARYYSCHRLSVRLSVCDKPVLYQNG